MQGEVNTLKVKKGYCVLCGIKFFQQGSRAFRCTDCRDLNAAKLGIEKRFCFNCGVQFVPADRSVHFCSDACKALGSRRARKETGYEERARIAKEAWDKEKMSYGQYVAKYGL